MKTIYTLAFSILGLTALNSCSVYRNNPTPDDVYYSQGQQQTADNNSDYYSTPNDNYVKMRVQDPTRWSYFDDYGYDYYGGNYGYSPYYGGGIGFNIGFGMGYCPYYGGFGYYSPMSYMNSYYAWNNFYNPYYGHVIVINGHNTATPSYTRMSSFNPTAYKGRYYNTRPSMTRVNTFNNYSGNSNNNSNYYRSGNSSNSNYRPAYSQPTHTSTSSYGGGSSFGGGGGGGGSRGGGFSRPSR